MFFALGCNFSAGAAMRGNGRACATPRRTMDLTLHVTQRGWVLELHSGDLRLESCAVELRRRIVGIIELSIMILEIVVAMGVCLCV